MSKEGSALIKDFLQIKLKIANLQWVGNIARECTECVHIIMCKVASVLLHYIFWWIKSVFYIELLYRHEGIKIKL